MADDKRSWSIKSVPEEVRTGVTLAARKARMGISEWVVRALWAQLQAEQQATTAVAVQQPAEPAAHREDATQEIIAMFAAMREAVGEPPPAVARRAWGLVDQKIKANTPKEAARKASASS